MVFDNATFTYEFHCFEHAFGGCDLDFDLTFVFKKLKMSCLAFATPLPIRNKAALTDSRGKTYIDLKQPRSYFNFKIVLHIKSFLVHKNFFYM